MTIGAAISCDRSFALFVPPPPTRALMDQILHAYGDELSGWVVGERAPSTLPQWAAAVKLPTLRALAAEGRCECAYEVARDGDGGFAALAPRGHGAGPREFRIRDADERQLLRILAPESAVPGLNWGLGFDALRVLEAERDGGIDWLVSIDATEEEDILERIACGVQGESFRRDRRMCELKVERVPSGGEASLALPEACRIATTVIGALPADADLLWRVTPTTRGTMHALERCIAPRPFWGIPVC